jgi:hypothetical protein
MPFSRVSLSAMTFRVAASPGIGAYFVSPRLSDSTAACLMNSGVSASGSPAVNAMTLTPLARRSAARAAIASVTGGLSALTLAESSIGIREGIGNCGRTPESAFS